MLPKTHRLTRDADFTLVYKRGRSARGQHLRLISLPNSQNASRFGFVVSKKHAAKIVMRNRIKRILRDEAAKLLKQLKPGFDVIIQGQPGIKNLEAAAIRQELISLLKKTKLLS